MRSCARLLAASLALAAGGCGEEGPVIDPFPIAVDRSRGALAVSGRTPDGVTFSVVIDTLTPFSVVDSFEPPAEEVPVPRTLRTTLDLLSTDAPPVARARFESVPVLDIHPCRDPAAVCRVGLEDLDGTACGDTPGPRTVPYRALVGGDLLSLAALRLDFIDDAAPTIRLFPDIAGDRAFHCRARRAVITAPLSGGSTISIEGGEMSFGASRVPMNVCAEFDPDTDVVPSGTDLLLLLATGLGPTVMTESAYARHVRKVEAVCAAEPTRCDDPDDPFSPALPFELLPAQCLQLPSGPTVARVARLRRLAVVGNGEGVRGPCEERRASRLMAEGGCLEPGDACPCKDENDTNCRAAAAVELEPTEPLEVAVLPDSHPLLQGLREELRPRQAEVDGLLGLDAVRAVRLDIDYPNQRLLFQCGDEPPTAGERPACAIFTEVFDTSGGNANDRCPDPP